MTKTSQKVSAAGDQKKAIGAKLTVVMSGKPLLKSAGIGEYTKYLGKELSASGNCNFAYHIGRGGQGGECADPALQSISRVESIKWCEIDVYHSTNHFIPLSSSRRVGRVLTVHDISHRISRGFFPLHKIVYKDIILRSSVKRADQIIAVSRNTQQDIVNYLRVPESRITVIHNGVAPVFSRQLERDTLQLIAEKYALPENFILSVGTIEPRKNYLRLIQAFEAIRNDIDLVIVGKCGWLYTPVLEMIRASKKKRRIHLVHNVDAAGDLAGMYQMAQLFVYPSLYEGFGLPVAEAMVSRIPVITSNTSSLPEVGGDHVSYIDPGDWRNIAERMKECLRSYDAKLLHDAELHARRFSWEAAAGKTLELYRKVVEQKK